MFSSSSHENIEAVPIDDIDRLAHWRKSIMKYILNYIVR